MIELTVPAALEELEHVQEFVEQALEAQGISMKIQMQISIAGRPRCGVRWEEIPCR